MLNHLSLLSATEHYQNFEATRLFTYSDQTSALKRSEWPSHFEGSALHPEKTSKLELLFASTFQEASATFHSAGREVILRRATRGTRRLQSAETCLRKNGFEISNHQIDSENWLSFYAKKEDQRLHLRELITDGYRKWHSPSAWFWHATMNPKSSPWLAATVITPLK